MRDGVGGFHDDRRSGATADRRRGRDLSCEQQAICRGSLLSPGPGGGLVHVAGGAVVALGAEGAWVAFSVHLQDGTNEVRAFVTPRRVHTVAAMSVVSPFVAVYASNVYWLEGAQVRSASLDNVGDISTTGPTHNIGSASGRVVTNLRVGAYGVYVATETSLQHISPSGTTTTIVSEPVDELDLDGASVYWTSVRRGVVAKTPLRGGPSTVLATNVHPRGVAVDVTSAYFVDEAADATTIKQVTPK